MKAILFFTVFMMISFSVIHSVDATQLTANINPYEPESEFTVTYQTTIIIEYNEGGTIKDILEGKRWTVQKTVDISDPESIKLAEKLNQKISRDGSGAQVSDLSVKYQAILSGKSNAASIDYSIILTGTLSEYTIPHPSPVSESILVDMNWRGLSVNGPVLIEGYNINSPFSAIIQQEPDVHSLLEMYPNVINLLSVDMIDAQNLQETPLADWHFLFDSTSLDAAGLSVTEYSLNINRMQQQESRAANTISESFEADTNYNVVIIHPPDSASIRIAGFAVIDTLNGIEILGIAPMPPEGFAVTTTGEAPFYLVYGLPITLIVAAAIIGYFLFKKGNTFF